MSTNIHIVANRQIYFFNGKGEKCNDYQQERFKVWQTPSDVTLKIMETSDKISAYKEWVLSLEDKTFEEPIYDYSAGCDSDFSFPIIGVKICDERVEHIQDFEKWLLTMEEGGYQIEFEAW